MKTDDCCVTVKKIHLKGKANIGSVKPGVSLVSSSGGLKVYGAGIHKQVGFSSQNQLPQHPQHLSTSSTHGVASFEKSYLFYKRKSIRNNLVQDEEVNII